MLRKKIVESSCPVLFNRQTPLTCPRPPCHQPPHPPHIIINQLTNYAPLIYLYQSQSSSGPGTLAFGFGLIVVVFAAVVRAAGLAAEDTRVAGLRAAGFLLDAPQSSSQSSSPQLSFLAAVEPPRLPGRGLPPL